VKPGGHSISPDQFHDNETGIFEFAYIINGSNIRGLKRRQNTGFLKEPGASIEVVMVRSRKEFESYFTTEPGILGPIDFAHATLAQPGFDFIMKYSLSNHPRG